MSILKELAARLKPDTQAHMEESKAVTPIYEEKHLAALKESIATEAPEWLQLWFEISLETGGRTADIAGLRFSNLNMKTGELRYQVAKQSKAALARAARKGIEHVRRARMDAADDAEYRKLASAPAEDIAASLAPHEEAIIADALAKARAKTDSKFLSPALVSKIQKYQDKCFAESSELMFPASCTGANRSQGLDDKPVSRQTIWRRMKDFMLRIEALATDVALHLSAYSTRKIAAYLWMKAGDREHPGSGITLVMQMLGHSSIEMSRRYLGLDKLSAMMQRNMTRHAA